MITVPLATAKARLSAYVDDVHTTHERVTITRNGVPASVLIAINDLEALEETLAVLSDAEAMREIREAERELDAGLGEAWSSFEPRAA
ncbi:MAG: type II toxin-antitoxin system Phd/YefM family antitoxin [Propionibacteriaceae bacterium]|nr:type II toxin-antitoxin system Phd/YefM family antitoxin [Propionibacteriaceae bacterium]